jgi:hypothetical protein
LKAKYVTFDEAVELTDRGNLIVYTYGLNKIGWANFNHHGRSEHKTEPMTYDYIRQNPAADGKRETGDGGGHAVAFCG